MPRPLCSRPAPKYVDKKRQENGYKTAPATSSRGYEPPAKRGYEPKYAKRAVTVTTSAKKQTTVDKAIDGVDTFLQNATGQFGGLTSNSPIAMLPPRSTSTSCASFRRARTRPSPCSPPR